VIVVKEKYEESITFGDFLDLFLAIRPSTNYSDIPIFSAPQD